MSAGWPVVWTPDRIIAVAAGTGLLVALLVFLFGKRRPSVASAAGDSPEVTVVVEGGYSPDLIRARVGRPLRLIFDRRDASPCTDEIVFPIPFWFESIRTPRRFAFDHSVVASFGYARAMVPATSSEKARVSS